MNGSDLVDCLMGTLDRPFVVLPDEDFLAISLTAVKCSFATGGIGRMRALYSEKVLTEDTSPDISLEGFLDPFADGFLDRSLDAALDAALDA